MKVGKGGGVWDDRGDRRVGECGMTGETGGWGSVG